MAAMPSQFKRKAQLAMWSFAWGPVCVMLVLFGGCSRSFWRHQADQDAYEAISQKLNDPRWQVPRMDVTPDQRSRFYDPYDPDFAPLPPDDPSAHVFMHWADGWEGFRGWHKLGDAMSVENPQWLERLGLKSDAINPFTGNYMAPVPAIENLTLPDALELTMIHSRDYQTQIENVYLAALDVSFNRFQFQVRYLGTGNRPPSGDVTGTILPHRGGDSMSAGGRIGVSQLLPAGTQWAVELANDTIWLFSGGNQTRTASALSWRITQPLLLGAGRKVGLENLTQSERNLLYAVRDLARFRQVLFTNVVAGTTGYLPLLRQLQEIRNQQNNIARVEEQLDRLISQGVPPGANAELDRLPAGIEFPPEVSEQLFFRETLRRLYWRGHMTVEQERILRELASDPANEAFNAAIIEIITTMRRPVATLDILQLQSQLTNSINQLRNLERGFQDSLDSFKFLLGLPPDVYITIDDTMLEPFEVIDPLLEQMQVTIQEYVEVVGAINDTDPNPEQLRAALRQYQALFEQVKEQVAPLVAQDVERVHAALPNRLAAMETPEDAEQLRADLARALLLHEDAVERMRTLEANTAVMLRDFEMNPDNLETRLETYDRLNTVREEILRLVQNLTVVQVSLRVELIDIQPFNLSMEEVIAQAMENRVDLMNARANVMDLRRKVEVAANRLQAVVGVVVEGSVETPPLSSGNTKPFDFRAANSDISAGVQFTAPLDQRAVRNAYRQALINYQRERRNYMQFEDDVKLDVRRAWRQLMVLRRNLETSRRAVRIAALQYDSAVNQTLAPAPVGGGGGGGGGSAGLNLLQALGSILSAQNQLIANWINYEQNRLNIYRDMGTMVIGPDGIWNDPFYRNVSNERTENDIRGQSPLDRDAIDSRRTDPGRLVDGADELGWARLPAQSQTGTETGFRHPD